MQDTISQASWRERGRNSIEAWLCKPPELLPELAGTVVHLGTSGNTQNEPQHGKGSHVCGQDLNACKSRYAQTSWFSTLRSYPKLKSCDTVQENKVFPDNSHTNYLKDHKSKKIETFAGEMGWQESCEVQQRKVKSCTQREIIFVVILVGAS